MTSTEDWKGEGRKTVWYNSRFYRMNLLWEAGGFRVRDIHIFDQDYSDPYLDEPLRETACEYDALPVVDGFNWSGAGDRAGIRVIDLAAGGAPIGVDAPAVREDSATELVVTCPLDLGGTLEIRCGEREAVFRFSGVAATSRPALALTWRHGAEVPFVRIDPQTLHCRHKGFAYRVACREGHFEPAAPGEGILLVPAGQGVSLAFGGHCEK